MNLSSAAEVTSGVLIGDDHRFTGVNTDTRQLNPGELFVAIPGENFDGHDFLDAALERSEQATCRRERTAEVLDQLRPRRGR